MVCIDLEAFMMAYIDLDVSVCCCCVLAMNDLG